MDFTFSEDQQALRELARKILEERAGHERLKQIEAGEERVDRELWRELARANLLGVATPEAFGGMGLGLWELVILFEELGRAVAPVPAFATLVLGALPVHEFGSDEQRERWLPRVVEGESFLSMALHEPGAPDPAEPATRAKRTGGGFRLEGRKRLVPAVHLAERVLVPARVEGEASVAVFLVDPREEGVHAERQETTCGEPRFDLELTGVFVGNGDVLAGPQRGAAVVPWVVERATAVLCAFQLGVAERALRMTASYASERRQFDRPIGSFQAVHQRAADAYIDVEAMRLTLWQAVHRLAVGAPAADALAVAKYWASEAGNRVVYAAQHLHGGIGVDRDYPLHRYYLHARDVSLALGSATEQLAKLGAAIAAESR